mmetsp:Transcript_68664/g.135848  ORF Transcript_68664/g.135848 Transcript_68664/m.135848 type:complete len:89 (+) Transcript_68664:302-568(+)
MGNGDMQRASSDPASPMSMQLTPPQPMAPKSVQMCALGFMPGPLALKQGSVSVMGLHSVDTGRLLRLLDFVDVVVVVVVVGGAIGDMQ